MSAEQTQQNVSTNANISTPKASRPAESEASATAPPAPTKKKPTKEAALPKKIQKRLDVLLNKVEKLSAENKKLKEQYKVAKAATTRIHRIPKKST